LHKKRLEAELEDVEEELKEIRESD